MAAGPFITQSCMAQVPKVLDLTVVQDQAGGGVHDFMPKKRRNIDSCIVREAKVSVFENDEDQVGNGGEREGFGEDERHG